MEAKRKAGHTRRRKKQKGRGVLGQLVKRSARWGVRQAKQKIKQLPKELAKSGAKKVAKKALGDSDLANAMTSAAETGLTYLATGANPLTGALALAVEMGINAGQQAKEERKARLAYRKKNRAIGGRFWNMGEGRGSMYRGI